jgi:hypothetical protein
MTRDTSRIALASLDLATLRGRVYRVFQVAGARGWTDEELWDGMKATQPDLKERTVGARRAELVADGHLVDSGRTRTTRSGRQAIVWVTAANEGTLGI